MTTIIIDDSNLNLYVGYYLRNNSQLPTLLKNTPIGDWGQYFSNITNMSRLFEYAYDFNEPLNNWGPYLGSVTDMKRMFTDCRIFNQPLDNWNVSNVTTMERMFDSCKSFNQPLNNWDVSSVTSMENMFNNCNNFNQRSNDWNVSNVTNMSGMFRNCEKFNQPLDDWGPYLGGVRNMSSMFYGCKSFNQPLNNWNVSDVTDMSDMFCGCKSFNQPLNNWNVSNVTDMSDMFYRCKSFNQPLNNWNVSNVTNMSSMFCGCESFNQPLNDWNIGNNTNVINMFLRCPISEANKPGFRRRPQIRVDAMQVHKASAKVNVTGLISFFAEKIPDIETQMPSPVGSPSPFATYIKTTIQTIIDALSETPEKKTELTTKLTSIYENRLNRVDLSQFFRDTLKLEFYSLEYVKTQNDAFKDLYVNSYLQDCVAAYEAEGTAGMSCVAGIMERIFLSLTDACAEDRETNPDHNTIINLLENVKSINDRIMDWYKLHKIGTPGAFPEGKTIEEKKSDLRTYLLPFFPGKETEINQAIETMSSAIGFDNEDFTYGGKKRKTKRKIKNKRRKTRKNKRIKPKKK